MQAEAQPLAIDARGVELAFGEQVGVFDLSFQAPAGSIFGMIGPSGCGKTTTVRLMTGLHRPQRGTLRVLDHEPAAFPTAVRERIGYIPQHFVLYPNLTVAENIHFVAALYGMSYTSRVSRMKEVLEFVQLSEARDRLGSRLSGGMQRRLMLAGALMHEPALLFADEPTAGIDPVLRSRFWDFFRQLRDEGRTLFVTTQYVGEATYCDMVAVMRAGRLVAVDTPRGLRRRALGGEIVVLTVEPTRAAEAYEFLRGHRAVDGIAPDARQPEQLHVTTDNARATLPLLMNALREGPGIAVVQAEELLPPFDDVFVRLMEQAGADD
jgi:ABC-2 type transport system ATP-binding protein